MLISQSRKINSDEVGKGPSWQHVVHCVLMGWPYVQKVAIMGWSSEIGGGKYPGLGPVPQCWGMRGVLHKGLGCYSFIHASLLNKHLLSP